MAVMGRTYGNLAFLPTGNYICSLLSTEFVHFHHRIGDEGKESILKESIHVYLAPEDMKRTDKDGMAENLAEERAGQGIDRVHRLHRPVEECHFPHRLQTAEQNCRLLP